MPRSGKSATSIALMAILLLALPALAVLQYRWIGQVSRAELERMQARLRSETARFSSEFNAELQGAFLALQKSPSDALASKLIGNLYRLDRGRLMRFDRARGSFEPAAWPRQLESLRERLEPEDGPPHPRDGMPPAVDEGAPALVVPLYPPRPGQPPPPLSIAELDAHYLETEALPELVRKHFSEDSYAVRIVNRARASRLVYESEAGLPPDFFAAPDAQTTIFDVRPAPREGRPGARGPDGDPRPAGPGRWEVFIKRRDGSLEAAVSGARRRNLAVSFAILSVMAASMAMLFVSTRRAQRLGKLQMEFVAGVSHELRTPLAVICSAGDNLADGLIASPSQVTRYGGLIRQEGHRLSEMVEQILQFAGIEAGRAKFEPRPVDVASVIQRALKTCEASVVESGCKVDERIDAGLPPVMADETSLAHCVGNLIGNACKYGKEGKWVGVRARMADNGNELRISVEDKGPGIEAADLPHIFDPFYRGSKAVADQIHGAGLGLSLVKRIVEAHGGGVEVARGRNGGACFTLRLKVQNGTANPAG